MLPMATATKYESAIGTANMGAVGIHEIPAVAILLTAMSIAITNAASTARCRPTVPRSLRTTRNGANATHAIAGTLYLMKVKAMSTTPTMRSSSGDNVGRAGAVTMR
jgi:hypothetical protein